MLANTCRFFGIVLVAALLALTGGQAQESKAPEAKQPPREPTRLVPFAESDAGLDTLAWAHCMAGVGPAGAWNPWGVLGARALLGSDEVPLGTWRFIPPTPFAESDAGLNALAWFACMGNVPPPGAWHPWGALGARVLASNENFPLTDWQFVFEKVMPIDQRFLDAIRDGQKLPDVGGKALRDLKASDLGLYLAFAEALRNSKRASMDMFDKAADDNRAIVYTHLASKPKAHRGKIITVRGKIAFIREENAPSLVHNDGIMKVYTTFIVGPTKGAPPFAAVFTELPDGVTEPFEGRSMDVKFEGYFLTHILVPPDKNRGAAQKELFSPWLIGKTLTVEQPKVAPPPPTGPETAYSYYLIVGTLGGIVAVGVFLVVLNIFFGRGDRRVQSQLAEVRDRQNPFNIEPAEETPAPAVDHANGAVHPEVGAKELPPK